jgi:serine/threonine protein kinase
MPPESPTARCNKCGRPKSVGDKGSLTQWIVCCDCVEGAAEEPSPEPVDICGKCKKPISSGRAGSFTQWVFRSDLCSCDVPEAMRPSFEVLEQQNPAEYFDDADELQLEGEPPFPLERYKPLMEVGQGTSGHVYLCKDRLLEKKVAIKCLRAVTPEQLIAFQREAKATSLLKHPGVVSVLDFGGTAGGAPFMVMEYVEGTSLFDYINERGPLPVDVTLTVIRRVAEALAHAHERGVYHRDVKSSNIVLLGGENAVPDVRVIDFGVAGMKRVIDSPATEQGDTIVGTPAYMSPDQAQGHEYDQRSEIYSLGCVMFETLTGRPPFHGETALETISKHAHEQAPMLGDVDEDTEFPTELESLVGRCLEKDPDDRFQNMSELIEAIRSIAPLLSSASASSVSQNQTATFAIDQSSSISRKGFKWVAIAGGAALCVFFFGLIAFNPNALNQIKTLFSSNPEESVKLTEEAWSELARDNYQKAIELSTRAVELDKENFEALDARGVAYFVNGDTKNALASLNMVIKNPAASQQSSSAAQFHRDVVYLSMGKSIPKRTNIPSSYANYVPTHWEAKKFSQWIGDEWRLLPVSGPKARPGAKKNWPKELDPNEEFKEIAPANSDENSSSNPGAESGGTVGVNSGLNPGAAPGATPGANNGSTSGLNSGGNAHLNSTSEDAGMLPEVRAVMKAAQ